MSVRKRIARDLRLMSDWARVLPTIVRARPGASFTVADAIEEVAKRSPQHPALVFEDQTVSYRELDREANRVARWAQAQGVARGEVVALLMENRPEFVIHWQADSRRICSTS